MQNITVWTFFKDLIQMKKMQAESSKTEQAGIQN